MSRDPRIPNSPSQADYERVEVENSDATVFEGDDPWSIFGGWLEDARKTEINDPNAFALATSDRDGLPDVRMVLLKDFAANGLVFYSNQMSAKGQQLAANAQAGALFHWKSLRRQVRFRGPVQQVSDTEADAYFQERARAARIGAWASDQSRPMPGRFALEKRIAEFGLKYATGKVPRPPHWHGWRIEPTQIEFWRDRAFRLHDRVQYCRNGEVWTKAWLFP